MIQHVIQKKRVIVMDCDITIGEDAWKKIMRHVLGRHFADLRGNGPGWSFSHTHLDTFCRMVQEHLPLLSNEPETPHDGSEEEPFSSDEKSFQDSETQTTDDGETSVQNSSSGTQTTDNELNEEEQHSVQNSLGTQTTDDEQSFVHDSETQTVDEKSIQDSETQTCSKHILETKKSEQQHVYKFDVDDQVRFFVDHWIQKTNFLLV